MQYFLGNFFIFQLYYGEVHADMEIRHTFPPFFALFQRRFQDPKAHRPDQLRLLQQRNELVRIDISVNCGTISEQCFRSEQMVVACLDLRLIAQIESLAILSDTGLHFLHELNRLKPCIQIFL